MSMSHRSTIGVLAGAVGLALAAGPVGAHEELTVVSWGGAYTASQMRAYVDPYRESGRLGDMMLEVERYSGGLDEVEAQVRALNVKWDVVDLGLSDALRGCRNGVLERIDHAAILTPGPDGTPTEEDFLAGMLPECAVGENVFSTVFAYDKARYPGTSGPKTIADFFDVQTYPGPRGLRSNPRVVLEWALMAGGVPPTKVYEVLDTEEGIARAFAKLNTIKPNIVWWQDAAAPVRLLDSGKVVMTQTYNGRVQEAIDDGGRNFAIVWDGQVYDYELWAVPKGTRHLEQALDFIAFASEPARIAAQSRHIAYGPARRSALAMLDEATKAKLPTAPGNTENALRSNEEWWAAHQARLNKRFEEWRLRGGVGGEAPTQGTAR